MAARIEEEARLAEEAEEAARIAEISRLAFENTIYGQRLKAEAEAAKLETQQRIAEETARQVEASQASEEEETLSIRDWLALSVEQAQERRKAESAARQAEDKIAR